MSLHESESISEISHPNPETNKKLQQVIDKVLKVLENDPELQKDFTEKFQSVFHEVTNDPKKLDTLLSNIESHMIWELEKIYKHYQNSPDIKATEAKQQAREIISKYTHMWQFALKNSI